MADTNRSDKIPEKDYLNDVDTKELSKEFKYTFDNCLNCLNAIYPSCNGANGCDSCEYQPED